MKIKNGWEVKRLISKKHYHNGKLHHDTKPACIDLQGNKYWYRHGRLHRSDGPAIERVSGSKHWYINGQWIADTKSKFEAVKRGKHTKLGINFKIVSFYKNFNLHKEDGPALIEVDMNRVTEKWYLKGKLHRKDGPAITNFAGYSAWYKHGAPHREDGPAIVDSSIVEYWFNGELINCSTDKEFKSFLKLRVFQ